MLGGIATNFGVESTARNAYQFGYHLVFAEDAMGRVRATEEILLGLGAGK